MKEKFMLDNVGILSILQDVVTLISCPGHYPHPTICKLVMKKVKEQRKVDLKH